MKFLLILAISVLTFPAFSSSKLDPKLTSYMRNADPNRIVRVIVTFNSVADLSRVPQARVGDRRAKVTIQKYLMENVNRSQSSFYAELRKWRNDRVPFKHRSLWIINGMIMDLPVSALNRLASFSSVKYVKADEEIRLINPVAGRRVSNRAADNFTYGLTKIMVPEFRNAFPGVDGEGVRVAVLDTGIDPNHPDLKGKVVAFADFVNGKKEAYDDNGHGTHVSGTIAGSNASGEHIGIAPKVQLIGAKFLSATGSGSFAAALLAMQWIADPDGDPNTADGAMIVNNSWGGSGPNANQDPKDNEICAAVDAWVKLGILPVSAAGNAGPRAPSLGLPGGCPGSYTIAASDSNDEIARFSSRGPAIWKTGTFAKPDISAPGVNVKSSIPGGGYREFSGTSMATPHIAGVAALVYQMEPTITSEKVMELLNKTTTKIGDDLNSSGNGRVDVLKAARVLKPGRVYPRY